MGVKRRFRQNGFWTTAGAVAGVLLLTNPNPVLAQGEDFATGEDDEFLEEVVVTGTRIKRRDFTSPSPIATIDRMDFEFSGQPTLEEYLNQMPQVQPDVGRSSNSGSDGTAKLNLRGLGAGRTLVLLNGRRVAPSGVGSAVDVNNLPKSLIDRVEIITGGASTVYGSDAIAGVINFITRDDFDGLSFDSSYNISAEGDAKIYDANIVYGHELASGRGNITLFAGYYEREELFAAAREHTRTVWLDTWEGELIPWGSPAIPGGRIAFPRVDLGTGRDRVTWNPDGTPRAWDSNLDRYNFAPINYLQTPLTRYSAGLMSRLDVSDNLEAYFEAAYTSNESQIALAEPPFFGPVVVNTDNPVLTPETRQLFEEQLLVAPDLAGFFLTRRMLELGPRLVDHDREYVRLVAGIRGEVADGWELDAWLSYTDASESTFLRNDGSRSKLAQGLLVDPATGQCFDPSGGCVPLDLFGEGRLSQAGVDFIRLPPYEDVTNRTQTLAGLVVTGAPFDIWTGPLNMAFGAEWRKDDGNFKADDALFTGDTIGFGGTSPVVGSESVYELYSEALVPLIDNPDTGQYLGLELGARLSEYQNAGSVTTWKAGLEWKATESLRFRAMQQHSVRAPNNQELFAQQRTLSSFLISDFRLDPCSASQDPAGSGNADKCILQGLPVTQLGLFEATAAYPVEFILGGNPDLVPEESDTTTVGLVFNPVSVPDLTIALDFFELEVTDTIGNISAMDICFDPLNTGHVFCDNMVRDASGNISQLSNLISNRGLLSTEGFDTQLRYSADLPAAISLFDEYAQLSINSTWTHISSAKSQENIVTEVRECAGRFGWPCQNDVSGNSYPENRVTSNFNYASGPLNIHLTWRWIDSMNNAAPLSSALVGFPDPDLAVPGVPSRSYFDLGFAYRFSDRVNARLGINNLLDKEPPQMADASRENNTDARFYDVYGRAYYVSLNWNIR